MTDDVCANVRALSRLMSDFLNAYNASQTGLADQFFAPNKPAFQWYSEPGMRLGEAALFGDSVRHRPFRLVIPRQRSRLLLRALT